MYRLTFRTLPIQRKCKVPLEGEGFKPSLLIKRVGNRAGSPDNPTLVKCGFTGRKPNSFVSNSGCLDI